MPIAMNSQHTRNFCVVIHPTLSDFFLVTSDGLNDDSIIIEYKKHNFAQKNFSVRTVKADLNGEFSLPAICEIATKNSSPDEALFCVYINTDVYNKLSIKDFINKTV